MLVLTRQEQEEIVIVTPGGERIVLVLCSIRGDKVRIGVDAPTSYAVHRREVLRAIEAGRLSPAQLAARAGGAA